MNDGASLLDGRVSNGRTHLGADRVADRLVDSVADSLFGSRRNNFINNLAVVAALLLRDGGADRL